MVRLGRCDTLSVRHNHLLVIHCSGEKGMQWEIGISEGAIAKQANLYLEVVQQ